MARRYIFIFLFILSSLTGLYAQSWQTLTVPATLRMEHPAQMKVSGRLTMVQGQAISFSARMLGMEVATLTIENDTVMAVDKWHHLYVRESLAKFLSGFPVSISDVQDALMGRMFIIGDSIPTNENMLFEPYEDTLIASPLLNDGPVQYGFQLDVVSQQLLSLVAAAQSSLPVAMNYDEWDETPYGDVASLITVNAILPRMRIDAQLEFNYNRAKWNERVKLPTEPTRGYDRVTATQLLKKITGLK